ncbi:MAG: tripartite tricarboxylate transporter substrate-binding protein, partial [Verrucomicrobiota bacterium]
TNRFGGELFNSMAGVKMTNVPYKGGGPAMVDVMGGLVEVGFGTLVQSLPHLRSGKLKAIGVTAQKRSPLLPDVPTIAESGLPGYYDIVWWGLLGPAGIPGPIISKLNTEVGAILKDPDMIKRLEAEAAETIVAPPEGFAKLIASDIEQWAKVAKEAGVRTE